MERSLAAALCLFSTCLYSQADLQKGKATFSIYCASCHGVEGGGLIGPNLTDAEVLHGEALADIASVVTNGIQGKAMPAWNSVLTEEEIGNVAAFVKSIMGKNIVGPNERSKSTVTPFPQGSVDRPLLIRTFLPALELPAAVFAHHGDGKPTARYSPKTGTADAEQMDPTIAGIPGAIAVNFGDRLSYCFDSTECRLLYVWSGSFLDMTNYWGAGEGGGRKRFGYLAELGGSPQYLATARPLFAGTPRFLGYRKVGNIPEFEYMIGDLSVTLRIESDEQAGVAHCHYTTNAEGVLRLALPLGDSVRIESSAGQISGDSLALTAQQAQAFTLSFFPTPSAQ